MKVVLDKLKNRIGTSMVEMLATVVLLGIMGVALAVGVSTIHRTYSQIVRKTNEQTLLSTTLIEMRTAIRNSVDYDAASGRFKSQDGFWFSFENSTDKTGIQIAYYMDKKTETAFAKKRPLLIKEQGEVSGIYSRFADGGGVSLVGDNVFEIKLLEVGEDENPTKRDSYKVRQLVKRTGGSE